MNSAPDKGHISNSFALIEELPNGLLVTRSIRRIGVSLGPTAGSQCDKRKEVVTLILLCLFDKFRFQFHGTNSVNFTVNIMVAFYEADAFHLGSNFQCGG